MMTPQQYLAEVVEPNYDEFRASPSLRRAINAATTTYHFYERLYWYFKEHNPGQLGGTRTEYEFRDYLIALHPDLRLLWDMADSVKHQRLRERKGPTPRVVR